MKRKILIFIFLINSVIFSAPMKESIVGKWIDDYGDMLIIRKRNNEFYADYITTKYIDEINATDEYVFRNRKVNIRNNIYYDVHGNGKLYFINKKGYLNVLDMKTKRILNQNDGTVYFMVKKE